MPSAGRGTAARRRRPVAYGMVLLLEALVVLTAVPAGLMLAAAPDGSLLGLPPELLDGTPFRSYRIPGLILALVVGGAGFASLAAVLTRSRFARLGVLSSGVLLVGWITVQVLLIGYQGLLQPAVLLVGILLCSLSWFGEGWPGLRRD